LELRRTGQRDNVFPEVRVEVMEHPCEEIGLKAEVLTQAGEHFGLLDSQVVELHVDRGPFVLPDATCSQARPLVLILCDKTCGRRFVVKRVIKIYEEGA
jgi:hypothetical protein